MEVFQKTVDPRVHSNTLAIEQLKAGQAKLTDSLELHKKQSEEHRREDRKFMEEKFETLEFLLTASQATATANPAPQPPAPRPQAPRPYYPPRQGARFRHPNGQQHVPGLGAGPGYRMNRDYNPNWRARGLSTEIPSSAQSAPAQCRPESTESHQSTPVAAAMAPMSEETVPKRPPPTAPPVMAAAAPMPHPVTDSRQQAFHNNDFWADHLEYQPEPMGYEPQGHGTYSYYPQDF